MFTTLAPSNPAEVVRVLVIGSLSDDPLRRIFDQSNWLLHTVSTCCEALTYLRSGDTAVVICERDLPDGDWKRVLEGFDSLPVRPNLIVTSRLANDELWAEVLNLGGYDVLAQPFDAHEVYRIVFQAWYAKKGRFQQAAEHKRVPDRDQAKSRAAT